MPSRCEPGAAHHALLEVHRAVLALLLPPGALVGEARPSRRARGAGGRATRAARARPPRSGIRRSGPTGIAQTTASHSNCSPVAVVTRRPLRRHSHARDRRARSGCGGRAPRPSAARRWPTPPPRACTPRPRSRRSPSPPAAASLRRSDSSEVRSTDSADSASIETSRARTALGVAPTSRSHWPTERRSSRSASGWDQGSSGSTPGGELAEGLAGGVVAGPVLVAHQRELADVPGRRSSPTVSSPGSYGNEGHERQPELLHQPVVGLRGTGPPPRRRAARGGRRPASSAPRARRAGCAPRGRPRPRRRGPGRARRTGRPARRP